MSDVKRDLEAVEVAKPAQERRAYVKPSLRHLGSVRELTLGKTVRLSDGFGGKLTS